MAPPPREEIVAEHDFEDPRAYSMNTSRGALFWMGVTFLEADHGKPSQVKTTFVSSILLGQLLR